MDIECNSDVNQGQAWTSRRGCILRGVKNLFRSASKRLKLQRRVVAASHRPWRMRGFGTRSLSCCSRCQAWPCAHQHRPCRCQSAKKNMVLLGQRNKICMCIWIDGKKIYMIIFYIILQIRCIQCMLFFFSYVRCVFVAHLAGLSGWIRCLPPRR